MSDDKNPFNGINHKIAELEKKLQVYNLEQHNLWEVKEGQIKEIRERIEKLEKEHKDCFFHLEEGKINLEWYTNVDKELSELKEQVLTNQRAIIQSIKLGGEKTVGQPTRDIAIEGTESADSKPPSNVEVEVQTSPNSFVATFREKPPAIIPGYPTLYNEKQLRKIQNPSEQDVAGSARQTDKKWSCFSCGTGSDCFGQVGRCINGDKWFPKEEERPPDATGIVVEKEDLEWLLDHFFNPIENGDSERHLKLREKYMPEEKE